MKNYVYRMEHDIGFAPNIEKGICTLSGCKKTTVEKWATKGSWAIGIGGNTTKPNNDLHLQVLRLRSSQKQGLTVEIE